MLSGAQHNVLIVYTKSVKLRAAFSCLNQNFNRPIPKYDEHPMIKISEQNSSNCTIFNLSSNLISTQFFRLIMFLLVKLMKVQRLFACVKKSNLNTVQQPFITNLKLVRTLDNLC